MENIKKKELIRLSKSCIGNSEKIAVNQVMNKEYLGMGKEVGLNKIYLISLIEKLYVSLMELLQYT